MNIINKLIKYIELGIYSDGENSRFTVTRYDDSGYPVIVDHDNRIRVEINQHEIVVKLYAAESGGLIHEAYIDWDCFTIPQKNKIIELIDITDDLNLEIEETLTTILTGVL